MFRFLKELVFFCIVSTFIWLSGIFDTTDPASLQIPAKPSASSGIYVQDYAGVLSAPVQSYLQELGAQLDRRTTAQLVVVTVKSLNGAPLEEYSLQILRQWGIGNKEKNNGVLMLISTGDRRSRIEVGYGLEGRLTDSFTGQIQDQYMIPYFRKGTYEEGIAKGYEALARSIAKEYNVQLAVSGYANHSPGSLKAGADGQSTEELFNKALAEQNGTVVQESGTASQEKPGEGESGTNQAVVNTTDERNVQSSPAASTGENNRQPDAPASSGEKAPEGILGFILNTIKGLYNTLGWLWFVLAFIFLDVVFLNGFLTDLFFKILLFLMSGSGGGGSGGGGSSGGGGFGGGSGGGGGSSRSW